MSDRDIRDQLLTLVFAGHETSGIALAWAINWLERTPPVRDRLLDELSALGDDPAPAALAAAPYLEAVCLETLRLYPVVGEVVRLLRAPMALGTWTIPAGVAVSAGIALVHARADALPRARSLPAGAIPRAEVRAARVPAVRRRRAPLHRRRVRALRDEGRARDVAGPHPLHARPRAAGAAGHAQPGDGSEGARARDGIAPTLAITSPPGITVA